MTSLGLVKKSSGWPHASSSFPSLWGFRHCHIGVLHSKAWLSPEMLLVAAFSRERSTILYDNDDSVGFGHLWTQSPTAGNEIDLTGLETRKPLPFAKWSAESRKWSMLLTWEVLTMLRIRCLQSWLGSSQHVTLIKCRRNPFVAGTCMNMLPATYRHVLKDPTQQTTCVFLLQYMLIHYNVHYGTYAGTFAYAVLSTRNPTEGSLTSLPE